MTVSSFLGKSTISTRPSWSGREENSSISLCCFSLSVGAENLATRRRARCFQSRQSSMQAFSLPALTQTQTMLQSATQFALTSAGCLARLARPRCSPSVHLPVVQPPCTVPTVSRHRPMGQVQPRGWRRNPSQPIRALIGKETSLASARIALSLTPTAPQNNTRGDGPTVPPSVRARCGSAVRTTHEERQLT